MANLRLATREVDNAELGLTQRDHTSIVPFSESVTELVSTSTMEGVGPNQNETPTGVGRHQDPRNENLKLNHADYTVAWICPLAVEEISALKMLDVRHQPLSQPPTDHNAYTLGCINGHNVVIASLPIAGNTHAATVVTQTRNTFPQVRFGLLVGIGGGVPTTTEHGPIRLGHVVVSKPTGTHSGAVQYDHGEIEHHKRNRLAFKRSGFLAPPPAVLLAAARKLDVARAVAESDPILDHLKRIDTNNPNLKRFKCPGIEKDHLYRPEYVHSNQKVSCRKSKCDPKQRVDRHADDSDDEYEAMDPSERVVVHSGTIASGEWVIKNGLQRDELAEKDDILCFEMEAAGVLADFPCLVIRGISDYADSHKNDVWQGFAAAVAGAYARELFFQMPVAEVKKLEVTESDIKMMVTGTGKLVQSNVDTRIKAWLSPPDPSTNYNAASAKHLDGTGSWFVQSKEFLSWRTTSSPSALWLYGKPGCGKTILTYAVIRELRTAIASSSLKGTILYYFFDFNDVEKQSPDNLVSSLLFQLSRQCENAGRHLKNLFENNDSGNTKPSVQDLCTTLQVMLAETVEPMIVLDALDECAARNNTATFGGKRLLEWLGQLQCRILVTSRREEDIESSIKRWETKVIFSLQDSLLDEDIRLYVHHYLRSPCTNRLAEIWQSEPQVLHRIETKVIEKASGMFRWVVCQLDALAEHDMKNRLFEALESLPATLTDTYRQILLRIPEIHQQDTARLLQFLVYARRPLSLKEAADALVVNPQHEQPFNEENRPRRILKYCTNLATIARHDMIYLAHFSVKEYFISCEDKGPFTKFLGESAAESAITEVSLAYISCLTGRFNPGFESFRRISDKYPFAEYCANFWMDHARFAEQNNEDIREKVFNFVSHPKETPYINCLILSNPDTHVIDYGPFDPEDIGTPLYLASLNGLRCTVERLIAEGADVNEVCHNTCFGFPLQAACNDTHVGVLRLLLDKGAEVDLSGGVLGCTSLMTALAEGQENAAHLLLTRGANPNIKGKFYSPQGTDIVEGRPLQVVSYTGSKKMAVMLLENGACINSDDGNGTALSIASRCGHEDLVRLLLQHGAAVGPYPLLYASKRGHVRIVRILLSESSPNQFLANSFNAALICAPSGTDNGQKVIELLLKHGADVNCLNEVSSGGMTLLEEAVLGGTESAATFLIEKGATLFRVVYTSIFTGFGRYQSSHSYRESPDSNGERLFLAACRNGWDTLIRLLLRRTICAQLSQDLCNCGLQIASYRGHRSVVQLLLSINGSAHDEPGEFGNALQAASLGGHSNIVRRLLKSGADPNRVDKHGWSALSIALRTKDNSVCEELLCRLTDTTLVESHNSSRILPPSTFITDQSEADISIYSDVRVVEAGRDRDFHVIFADHPFSATIRNAYVEIKVLDLGTASTMGLGVCRDDVRSYPGARKWSQRPTDPVGNKSDFIIDGWRSPIFIVNETYGCFVDYDTEQLFFTRNGKYFGRPLTAPVGRLYFAVGVGAGVRFTYDFEARCPVTIP